MILLDIYILQALEYTGHIYSDTETLHKQVVVVVDFFPADLRNLWELMDPKEFHGGDWKHSMGVLFWWW